MRCSKLFADDYQVMFAGISCSNVRPGFVADNRHGWPFTEPHCGLPSTLVMRECCTGGLFPGIFILMIFRVTVD